MLQREDLGTAAEVLREMTGLTFLNLVRLLWLTCLDWVLLRWGREWQWGGVEQCPSKPTHPFSQRTHLPLPAGDIWFLRSGSDLAKFT